MEREIDLTYLGLEEAYQDCCRAMTEPTVMLVGTEIEYPLLTEMRKFVRMREYQFNSAVMELSHDIPPRDVHLLNPAYPERNIRLHIR